MCDLRGLYDWDDFYVIYEELWLILLFNKIRFENKIIIEFRVCFKILESFGGESEIR